VPRHNGQSKPVIPLGLGLGLGLVIVLGLRLGLRIVVASQTAGESDKMRISHVIETDQWRCGPQIRPAPHSAVSL